MYIVLGNCAISNSTYLFGKKDRKILIPFEENETFIQFDLGQNNQFHEISGAAYFSYFSPIIFFVIFHVIHEVT